MLHTSSPSWIRITAKWFPKLISCPKAYWIGAKGFPNPCASRDKGYSRILFLKFPRFDKI